MYLICTKSNEYWVRNTRQLLHRDEGETEVKESEHLSKANVKPKNIFYEDNQISNCFSRNTSTITLRDTTKDSINIEPGGIPETQPEVSKKFLQPRNCLHCWYRIQT
jgi:hypothetical protein